MIKIRDLTYSYDNKTKALDKISLDIERGSFVSVVGHNGSGKSTLAKAMVGLLENYSGKIYIDDIELNSSNVHEIRKKIGIVFQNPDNQFVGSTVKHDIAFGLENQCLEQKEIKNKVIFYSKKVGMNRYLDKEPHQLSGGQKQRVAIAGALAMSQEIIIFDEATSMLDPKGRQDVINLIKEINQQDNITVLMITHNLNLAKLAKKMVVLKKGKVISYDSPKNIFQNREILSTSKIVLPEQYKLYDLMKNNKKISKEILEALWEYNLKM